MMTSRARNAVRRFSSAATLNRVDQMQYREKKTIIVRTITAGVPSQMRVLDSLSYFRIKSSTSLAEPTALESSGCVSCLNRGDIRDAPFIGMKYILILSVDRRIGKFRCGGELFRSCKEKRK